jgi:hypothetical protein
VTPSFDANRGAHGFLQPQRAIPRSTSAFQPINPSHNLARARNIDVQFCGGRGAGGSILTASENPQQRPAFTLGSYSQVYLTRWLGWHGIASGESNRWAPRATAFMGKGMHGSIGTDAAVSTVGLLRRLSIGPHPAAASLRSEDPNVTDR